MARGQTVSWGHYFCFKWRRTEHLSGETRAASGKAQGGPKRLSEERETDTRHPGLSFFMRKFSLVTLSGKKPAQTSVYIFFWFVCFHLRVSDLQRNGAVCPERRACLVCASEHLQARRVTPVTVNTVGVRRPRALDIGGSPDSSLVSRLGPDVPRSSQSRSVHRFTCMLFPCLSESQRDRSG